jgi:hypothetical protein
MKEPSTAELDALIAEAIVDAPPPDGAEWIEAYRRWA